MTGGWIGVASRDHVQAAVEGGFCQFNHGKLAPLLRMSPGDTIIYYAPRERMRAGKVVQAFVAIGTISSREPWKADAPGGFAPFRRAVVYHDGHDAAIQPLLQSLSFTRNRESWGQAFRRGLFRIGLSDVSLIADAIGITRAV